MTNVVHGNKYKRNCTSMFVVLSMIYVIASELTSNCTQTPYLV